MKKQCCLFPLLLIPILFVYPQDDEEPDTDKRNIIADMGYSALGVVTSNTFLNLASRLGNQSFADMTFEKIWHNLSHNNWFWEDGDRFLVNQFGHPYQGATYFASARINGFAFYESILFVPFGSVMWEVFMEPEPSINDFITTATGGIALGEMLHRLFLEVDSSPSVVAKIGGFFVNPIASFNKIYNRQPREFGDGNIYNLSVKTGMEKSFAFFPGHEEQVDSWNYPGGHINLNAVYGNPYVQQSITPYEHFELIIGLTTNIDTYNMAIISDGYLFSFNPVHTETTFTSTGLSMHYDFFNATNDIIDNIGYGNIQFSSSAVGWTAKHKHNFSKTSYLELKTHAAAILWGGSMYNGEHITRDYWVPLGDTRASYGMGENVKLLFHLFHEKAGKLETALHGYHIFSIPVTGRHSTGNVFFTFCSLDYCFPLGDRIGIGTKGTFWGLLGQYDSAENVNRGLVSGCLYIRFAL